MRQVIEHRDFGLLNMIWRTEILNDHFLRKKKWIWDKEVDWQQYMKGYKRNRSITRTGVNPRFLWWFKNMSVTIKKQIIRQEDE